MASNVVSSILFIQFCKAILFFNNGLSGHGVEVVWVLSCCLGLEVDVYVHSLHNVGLTSLSHPDMAFVMASTWSQ